MRDLFEKYVTMFYFDGKNFYFYLFVEIEEKLNFLDFEAMGKWFEENPESVNSILKENSEEISKINENYLRDEKERIENLTFAPVTLENITTDVKMFDET